MVQCLKRLLYCIYVWHSVSYTKTDTFQKMPVKLVDNVNNKKRSVLLNVRILDNELLP